MEKSGSRISNSALFLAVFTVFLLLSAAESYAEADTSLFDYEWIRTTVNLSNGFRISPTSTDFFVESVEAKLDWFPQEDGIQSTESFSTMPQATGINDYEILYSWALPHSTEFTIRADATVLTRNRLSQIKKKVSFPLKDLEGEYSAYLAPRKITDINNDIRTLAFKLAEGEDDEYVVAFKVARWVEDNIEYNMTTLTADAAQKSSWVLKNRYGVCDEITSLYISLLRSLGIPARFVTGVSYSNLNRENDGWGPHGWAEVYFPDYGWVPFDITYKELGYIDAAHVKLRESLDAESSSTKFETKGRNNEILPQELNIEVFVKDHGSKIGSPLELQAQALNPLTGFGSYNLLTVTVKNPTAYYIPSRLTLSNVNELTIYDGNDRDLLLKPGETKKIYWLLKATNDLDSDYIYTFPLEVSGTRGEKAEAVFKSSSQGKMYSEEYVQAFIESDTSKDKRYSDNVALSCSQDKDQLYLEEEVQIFCSVENKGSLDLKALKVCLEEECSITKINPGAKFSMNFSKSFKSVGVKNVVFSAENEIASKSYYVILDVLDAPKVVIGNITAPSEMKYTSTAEIKFSVDKLSVSDPLNLTVRVDHKLFNEEWRFPEFTNDYNFKLTLEGSSLYLDENKITISAEYYDELGHRYYEEKEAKITLSSPTITQRVAIFFTLLNKKIENLAKRIVG